MRETPNSYLSTCLVMVGIHALFVSCNAPILSLQRTSLGRYETPSRPSRKPTHSHLINIKINNVLRICILLSFASRLIMLNSSIQVFLAEIMTNHLSFQEFGQEFELTQVAEGKCPRIDASRLPCITKINHMVHYLGKLLPIMKYIDETLFERRYGRIAQLMRLPIQAASIKALLNF